MGRERTLPGGPLLGPSVGVCECQGFWVGESMSERCVDTSVSPHVHCEPCSWHFRRSDVNRITGERRADADGLAGEESVRRLGRSMTWTSPVEPSSSSQSHNHTRAFVHAKHDLQKGVINGTDSEEHGTKP